LSRINPVHTGEGVAAADTRWTPASNPSVTRLKGCTAAARLIYRETAISAPPPDQGSTVDPNGKQESSQERKMKTRTNVTAGDGVKMDPNG
jgi:hypothetical protein